MVTISIMNLYSDDGSRASFRNRCISFTKNETIEGDQYRPLSQ
jgi:hypothetical protein